VVLASMVGEPSLPPGERRTASGKVEFAARVVLAVRVIHSSGQWIEILTAADAQDLEEKAVTKAFASARRNGLVQLLNLTSGDDAPRAVQEARRTTAGGGAGSTQAAAGQEARTTTAAADPRVAQIVEMAKEKFGRESGRRISDALKRMGDAKGVKYSGLKDLPAEGLEAMLRAIEEA